MSEPVELEDNLEDKRAAARTDVWPPPPMTPSMTESYAPAFAFVPVQRLARAIMVLLSLDSLLSAYGILAAALLKSNASRLIAFDVVTAFHSLLILATGICFFVWLYRMTANLGSFGATELTYRPAWAVGYFFVPIMNLYRPFQVLTEIWQASGADPSAQTRAGRRAVSPPPLLGVWWGFWLLWGIVSSLAAQDGRGSASHAAGLPFRLIAAVLAIFVVRLYTQRQEETARSFALVSQVLLASATV